MEQYAAMVKKKFGEVPTMYDDYRDLLADPKIDKVIVATPEHWHARMIVDAVRAKKAVYTEKPMTHNTEEGLKVLKEIKRSGMIVQVGVQGMSDDSYSSAAEIIKTGILGQVVQAQTSYVRRYSDTAGPWRTEHNSDEPKPEDLDWNSWLGPARHRPWDARRYHDWRCYWDYSGGVSTDLFVHRITRIIRALELKEPIRGVGMGGIWKWKDGREVPDNFEMILEYPNGPTVYALGTMANQHDIQHCIRGYEATLVFEDPGFKIYSETDPTKVLHEHTRTGGEDQSLHHENHHAAMRAGDASLLRCPPELGYYGVVAVDLANESYKRKKTMMWSEKDQKVLES
jgi:predicted dehydrogenase